MQKQIQKIQRRPGLRSQSEDALWHSWNAGGRDTSKLAPLLDSLQPLVHQTVNKYQSADVALPALKIQAENQLIKGLHTYNPAKGGLSTHLNWQMRGVGRFVEKHQNLARIPAQRIRYIAPYQQGIGALTEQLGREPTVQELSKHTKIPQQQLRKLKKELAPVHVRGLSVDEQGAPLSDSGGYTFSADRERLELIYPDLTAQEQQVVDYSLGRAGKRKIVSNAELARVMGVSQSRVSNLRAGVVQKLQKLDWVR